jgi:hypothetical protein
MATVTQKYASKIAGLMVAMHSNTKNERCNALVGVLEDFLSERVAELERYVNELAVSNIVTKYAESDLPHPRHDIPKVKQQ